MKKIILFCCVSMCMISCTTNDDYFTSEEKCNDHIVVDINNLNMKLIEALSDLPTRDNDKPKQDTAKLKLGDVITITTLDIGGSISGVIQGTKVGAAIGGAIGAIGGVGAGSVPASGVGGVIGGAIGGGLEGFAASYIGFKTLFGSNIPQTRYIEQGGPDNLLHRSISLYGYSSHRINLSSTPIAPPITISSDYNDALKVGVIHNMMLDMAIGDSCVNYVVPQDDPIKLIGLNDTISDDFRNIYNQITSTNNLSLDFNPHSKMMVVSGGYKNAMRAVATSPEYSHYIANEYINYIENSDEFSKREKIGLLSIISVGTYSFDYWYNFLLKP